MTKAAIVYASLTGNTEEVAEILKNEFTSKGIDVTSDEISSVSPGVFADADICVIATYTWGDGDLPDEAIDFYEELAVPDLKGKKYGVIGTGDTSYELFCKSAHDFDDQFAKTGATKGADTVEIENDPEDDDVDAIKAFVDAIISA